jgi:hypothetical protein
MEKAHATWNVLPHGPLEQLGDRVWRVEGSLPNMPLKRVMAIVRRADDRLIVHNAIALEPGAMAALDRLGEVATIVVPNGWHRLDAPLFQARYPSATLVCPPGARAKVEEVTAVTDTYDRVADDGVARFEVLDGTGGREGALIVRGGDGATLILNDAVFNMPHLRGVHGLILRHLTRSSGGPRISRIVRLFVLKDRAGFRRHLERLAALPELRRILVAHHETIEGDAAQTLRDVAATL